MYQRAIDQKGDLAIHSEQLSALHFTLYGFRSSHLRQTITEERNHLKFSSAPDLLLTYRCSGGVTERAVKHKRLICPNCDGGNIHRSHRKNLIELASSLLFIRPFRCVDCHHRFWRYWLRWKSSTAHVLPPVNRTR